MSVAIHNYLSPYSLLPPTSHTLISQYYNMSFGFGICDLINASRLAFELISSYVRASDDFKRETDYLTITLLHIRQECEMLDYSISHASLCEPRFLTRMVHDWGTTLKQLEQLLKELKIDDGTTSRRIGQLKRRLYVYIERLKKDLAPHMSKIQAWSLAQRCLLVPDDASAFLQILVEEPIDVPMSGAAGSMDNTPIIYGSDKNLVAMRAPRKRCLEGRDSSLSSLLCSQGATAREKSTLVQPLIDEGVCTNFMTSTIYSYGLGEQEFWNSSISVTCTTGLSQESYCIDGLDEGTVLVSSSKLSDLNDLYNSFTKCNSASYYPLPISSSEDLSYGSSADLWSDETPRQWSFLRSSLKRLGHATSRVSFRTSKLLTLVSPVFFASSVSAVASHCGSQNDPVRLKTGPQDYSTWFQALGNIQGEFLYVSCFFIPLLSKRLKSRNLISSQNSSGLIAPV